MRDGAIKRPSTERSKCKPPGQNGVPSLCVSPGLTLGIMARKPEQLPDPWLFDSEALLRELDRCREIVLQIPVTNPNATHFRIQLAVNAIYNLTENLRYLLHLHREQQRSIRRQHEETLVDALAAEIPGKPKVVHLPRVDAEQR